MIDSKKYVVAFLITAVIFGTAIFVSNILSQKKLDDVRVIENRVALDILSSETQFALLEETSCSDIGPGFLSKELGSLGEKLTYAENQTELLSADLDYLKRSYFLLEIKDYLLMKRLTEKCGIKPTFILYFYSTEEACEDCERMGYVLTALRDKYPDLRVYSFDYHFDVGAINTPCISDLAGVKFLLEKERGFFFRGFRRVREAVEGRFVERTIQFRFTTRSARAISHHHEFLIK